MSGNSVINHKIVFIGDSSVGKTSIINQYMYMSNNEMHQPTVGIDFFAKNIEKKNESGVSQKYRFNIWDTAGQEKFQSLIPSYIRDSTICICVYDITNEDSFHNLAKWNKLVDDLASPIKIIVGNKTDLEEERAVTFEQLKQYADELGAKYIETSARAPTNIAELFDLITEIPPPPTKIESEADSAQLRPPAPVRTVNINQDGQVGQSGGGGCGC